MGRSACTEPQCLYSRAILLLPLWAVRPVQSLSACRVELYLYSLYGPFGLYRASVPVQGTFTLYSYHISSINLDSDIQTVGSRDHEQLLNAPQTPDERVRT